MKDLFDSTSFIKFEVLETILSKSDMLEKLLNFEEYKNLFDKEYSFEDYISNLDSYLYGLLLLDKDLECIKVWLDNYLNKLYLPLIKRDSLYILKSKVLKEILLLKNHESRVQDVIKNYLLINFYDKVNRVVLNNKDNLKIRLSHMKKEKNYNEYLNIFKRLYDK